MDPMVSNIIERVSNEADFSAGRWNPDIFSIAEAARENDKDILSIHLFREELSLISYIAYLTLSCISIIKFK
jgi:hypothetical protein